MPTELIVMRLVDMHKKHDKQITLTCSRCNNRVGVYPSGQEVLRQCPDTEIVCINCYNGADITVLASDVLGMKRGE
jgi:hypothetical protein